MKEEKEIVARFFAALERLAADGCIRGLKTFADRYHTNRGNMSVMRSTLSGIHVEWLTFLVRDYMVSPLWLLTGEGVFYREGWDAEMVKKCKPNATAKPLGRKPKKAKHLQEGVLQLESV